MSFDKRTEDKPKQARVLKPSTEHKINGMHNGGQFLPEENLLQGTPEF